jgi:hypothetical protein
MLVVVQNGWIHNAIHHALRNIDLAASLHSEDSIRRLRNRLRNGILPIPKQSDPWSIADS